MPTGAHIVAPHHNITPHLTSIQIKKLEES
jgi:hypothetical protein